MQQLEPILKYHFWILLGLALIVALTGWWMTTGQMEAAITQRRDDLKKAVDKSNVGDVPSKDWEVKLKAINDQQEKLVNQTRDQLYARQKEKMIWPPVIREFTESLTYREEITETVKQINYRDNYMDEVLRVYKIPRPIMPMEPEKGVVEFAFEAMPHRVWGDDIPTSTQMWDSMEDLWLLEPILNAVAEVNGGPNATRYDASVVSIEELKLRGGDRSKMGKSPEAAGGGGGGGGGDMTGGAMAGGAAIPGGFGGPMGGRKGDEGREAGGGAAEGTTSLDANDDLIFGDAGQAEASSAGTEDGSKAAGFFGGSGGGVGSSGEETGRRYIDDDTALPYRTRGFKLAVVMDHRKVPELYSQLTSSEGSPWPIQIIQMHVGRLSEGSGTQGALAMGGGAGFPAAMGAAKGLGGFNQQPFGGGGRRRDDDDDGGRGFRIPNVGTMPKAGQMPNAGQGMASPAGDVFDNPYLARVIVWGLITLYNEPEQKDQPASGTPSTETPAPTATPEVDPVAAGAPNDLAKETAADQKTADKSEADSEEMEADADAASADETNEERTPAKKAGDDTAPDSDAEGETETKAPQADPEPEGSDATTPSTEEPGESPAKSEK